MDRHVSHIMIDVQSITDHAPVTSLAYPLASRNRRVSPASEIKVWLCRLAIAAGASDGARSPGAGLRARTGKCRDRDRQCTGGPRRQPQRLAVERAIAACA